MTSQRERIEPADRYGLRDGGLHGDRLARHLGIQATSTVSLGRRRVLPMVITRLEGQTSSDTWSVPLPAEDAYSIVVQLAGLPHHELTLRGRIAYAGTVPRGAVSAISLTDAPRSRMSGGFDGLQFYVPKRFMDEVAREEGFSPPSRFSWPGGEPDPVALAFADLLVPALRSGSGATLMFVEHVALAFLAHAVFRYGEEPVRETKNGSALSPWQERRAKEIMRARFATPLTITEVSRECGLSPSYFASAFRRSTGRSPQRYLSEIRVEEAKRLMRQTSLTLADIALMCGFNDQSYFTRVFCNHVRASPARWRRVRAEPPTEESHDQALPFH